MRRNQVRHIAALLTEDPDVFMELDTSMDPEMDAPAGPGMDDQQNMVEPEAEEKPLNATEIEKEADEIAGDDAGNADAEIANELKAQQEAEMQAAQERQEMMQPQIDKLNSSLANIQTGLTQGQAQATDANQAFGGLDQEMAALKQVVANIGKTMS
jgi:chromosome segregation ATPase